MSLKLGDAGKSSGVTAPAGNHVARCYAIIDTGTHTETGQFGTKTNRKIRISWELPDETHVFKPEKGEEPFAVHKTYNFQMGEKATMRKDLESWRGRAFTPEELKDFELRKLLGATCMLNVVHVTKPTGTYANIEGITPLPKALKNSVKPSVCEQLYYEVTDGENEVFEKLPDFLKEIIRSCKEFSEPRGTQGAESNSPVDESDEDQIPF